MSEGELRQGEMAKAPKQPKEEGGKRFWLSARTTAELNQALKDASQKSGRSVSQEVEFRLEQSFRTEKAEEAERAKELRPLDADSEMLFKSIRTAAGAAMTHMRASWVDDAYARAAVKMAISTVFRTYTDNQKINIAAGDFDFARLQNSSRVGEVFGRLLGDLSGAPGGEALLQEVRDVLMPLAPTLIEATMPEDMRQDVALKELNVSVAA